MSLEINCESIFIQQEHDGISAERPNINSSMLYMVNTIKLSLITLKYNR